MPRPSALAVAVLGVLLASPLLSGCGSDDPPEEDRVVLSPAEEGDGHTHGVGAGSTTRAGDGTAPEAGGYRLSDVRLPGAGEPGEVSFRVIDTATGRPLTAYTPEQTKDLHLYVVRSDLAELRHLHPTLGDDGTWSARVALATPGSYRVITEFTPAADADGTHVVLGDTLLVPGRWAPVAVTDTSTADDGVVALEAPETLSSGPDERMTITVSNLDGQRLALGSYLGTFAHLTGFDTETGAFVHAHPFGAAEPVDGGDALTFHTEFEEPGTYRFFLQVRVDGFVHQVPFAATVT